MSRPRLLDLFCGAGGAAMGYHRAGFDVVGVDVQNQPHYPFRFVQADVMEYLVGEDTRAILASGYFDVIHASPPCQAYSKLRKVGKTYADLIHPVRDRLVASGLPYVIENVPGAPLVAPVGLCGSAFGLRLQRHRLFESNVSLWGRPCDHQWQQPTLPSLRSRGRGAASVVGVYGTGGGAAKDIETWKAAMGIDWMTKPELAEAIPPAYTEWIGTQLLTALRVAA